MNQFLTFILDRLSEPSTYKGLTLILATIGVNLDPSLSAAFISAAVAVCGAIEVFRKEKKV